nr:hypothetical protein BDOA9_0115650 [Bradyrhizobium sp. DOA9]
MGNGSIVPRQERFDTRHALCCISAHAVAPGSYNLENILGLKQFGAIEDFGHPAPLRAAKGTSICALQRKKAAARHEATCRSQTITLPVARRSHRTCQLEHPTDNGVMAGLVPPARP